MAIEVQAEPALRRSIKHDLRDFGLLYAFMAVLIVLLSWVTDQTGPLWGLSMFAAAIIVAGRFVKREGRAPSDAERKALISGSMLICVLISLVPFGLFIAEFLRVGVPSDMTVWLILFSIFGVLLILTLIYLFLNMAYGSLARRVSEKLNR